MSALARGRRVVSEKLRENFAQFAGTQVAGAGVLLGATVAALVLANSSAHTAYSALWETRVGLAVGTHAFTASLREIINDGLMTLFFLVVGLEIKREIVCGELSARRKAVLPIAAALGGMIVPAAIYIALNHGGPGASGWGIPMATDIAFAIGVMSLLGNAVPQALKVFLVSLAIVDDIGAIIVIAFAYSGGISWVWLALAAVALGVLVLLNRLAIDNATPYVIVGIVLWVFVLLSGVHSTIAGVLIAFAIPSTARLDPLAFCDQARETLGAIEDVHVPGAHVLADDRQQLAARRIRSAARRTAAPLQRLEFALHPWTTFVVLPLFALANAGVRVVDMRVGAIFGGPVALGVIIGLVLGKPIGIFGLAWIAERFHLAELPTGAAWRHMAGAALLGGIGFTMSVFISGLAFGHSLFAEESKASIILASLLAGLIGYAVLKATGSAAPKRTSTPRRRK